MVLFFEQPGPWGCLWQIGTTLKEATARVQSEPHKNQARELWNSQSEQLNQAIGHILDSW